MPIPTQPRLAARAPELAPDADLSLARRWLEGHTPRDGDQGNLRRRIVGWIDRFPESAHLRSCLEGHLTASALVVDEALESVVLLHHKKLGRWLQPGGHCDGDANLAGVAWREASEETGLDHLELVPRIFDLDIHEIPERPGVPAHLHLDTRFLVVAPRSAAPRGNEESRGVRWFDLDEALEICDDASLDRMLRLLRDGAAASPRRADGSPP
ncbi:MAG: NUDIX hydrolase [Acidobacteriota bacterium]